jgi:hypothetical protein
MKDRYMRDYKYLFGEKIVNETVLTEGATQASGERQNCFRPTRKYCVEDLYPRMLYSFSDVICFVTQQTKTAEVTLEKLIKWADKVLSKTINQPSLPYAIIVMNGIRGNPQQWLDEDVATDQLLQNAKQMEIVDPEMRRLIKEWSERPLRSSRTHWSIYDLIHLYFDGIRVVYVPSKENVSPDVLYQQLQQLRNRIVFGRLQIQAKREKSWSRLNTTELPNYYIGAFHHFSNFPNQPFDFYTVSKANSPRPEAFDQHMSHLMDKFAIEDNDEDSPVRLDERIARIVASCISIAILDQPYSERIDFFL